MTKLLFLDMLCTASFFISVDCTHRGCLFCCFLFMPRPLTTGSCRRQSHKRTVYFSETSKTAYADFGWAAKSPSPLNSVTRGPVTGGRTLVLVTSQFLLVIVLVLVLVLVLVVVTSTSFRLGAPHRNVICETP